MPNHVYNQLTIVGPKETILTLQDSLRGKDVDKPEEEWELCFNNIIPQPEGLLDHTTEKGEMPNWYWWRVNNWGTKWEPWGISTNVEHYDDYSKLFYHFKTAWAPPEEVFNALVENNATLTFHHSYTEEFGQMSGFWIGWDGEVVHAENFDFDVFTASAMMFAEEAIDHFKEMRRINDEH
jgi:hypothetical protein